AHLTRLTRARSPSAAQPRRAPGSCSGPESRGPNGTKPVRSIGRKNPAAPRSKPTQTSDPQPKSGEASAVAGQSEIERRAKPRACHEATRERRGVQGGTPCSKLA